ncbi:hypothetical protein PoB_005538600 [Plakobranchus ocellatus]|uniref:Uncharacterized protein n=1 Tax=Plakobranchus ocellatus TaxID=259542 RepID=A0AAV4C845_9GAST|nr:hypothetical protein PoB_005538600 [Plakobranchus ocellatus]
MKNEEEEEEEEEEESSISKLSAGTGRQRRVYFAVGEKEFKVHRKQCNQPQFTKDNTAISTGSCSCDQILALLSRATIKKRVGFKLSGQQSPTNQNAVVSPGSCCQAFYLETFCENYCESSLKGSRFWEKI